MGIVHVLPEHVANKIAAGEVVERPASIVKELVENALDAGAGSVEIAIKNGGKSLVRVSDDGCGMSEEDARLAFVRHATSKIAKEEDLTRIASFGFRGEALPSIAAVSRTRLVTCREGESAGTEVAIEGGHLLYCKGSAPRKGTLVEVRDLFFNTPARRKFLKADTTETGHIADAVSHFALAKPAIRFALESAGRKVLDVAPMRDSLERARAVFGDGIAKNLLEFDARAEGIRVFGLLGKPFIARANRTGQVFFVNQRAVRALSLSYALLEGYHGLMLEGQFPVAVLFFELDLERVDVNVHPTKQEVKISEEGEIKSFLKKAVTERLAKERDLAPHLRLAAGGTSAPKPREPAYEKQAEFVQAAALSVSEPPFEASFAQPAALAEPVVIKENLKITKILGQVHNTFLVAETEEGMMVIDQHAAHERVMFEVLLKGLREGTPETQGLLVEEVLEVHPRQKDFLEQSMPFLSKVGFELEPFGENAYVIRSYPAIFKDASPSLALRTFLEEREEGKLSSGLEREQEEVAALIACKRKSVTAFDPLTGPSMEALLARLARCENPLNCPHGRPTLIRLSFSDLERQFKRK